MSNLHNLQTSEHRAGVTVRRASKRDHATIRDVIRAAYHQYEGLIPATLFRRYLDDLLDLDRHARHGQLLVAEIDGVVRGFGAFYPDTSVQGLGWPAGWAGGRGLAVHPDARRHGVAQALLATCEQLARDCGMPVFAFHTASFMSGAVALYERLGYHRAPAYDQDLSAHFGVRDGGRIEALAYRRDLVPAPKTMPSYASGESTVPLIGETIAENFRRIASEHADRDALVDVAGDRRWTYAEMLADVDALARGLLALGIEKGDRVGIWAGNCPEWALLQYATAEIGAILVTINPAYRRHELGYVLDQSGISVLVAARSIKETDTAAMIAEVRPDCPALDHVVLIGEPDWHTLFDHSGAVDELASRRAALSPADPINIQYTSGTTGHPKGATLSHRNILNNAYFVGQICGYAETDRICIPVPLFHTFGMVLGNLGATTHGACMVYPAPTFDARATLTAVSQERCTSLYGVPAMFIAELAQLDADSFDLSSLRTGIMGGSPCPVEVMKQVVDRMGMTEMTICYGMTETSPVSTQTRTDDSLHQRVSTVGRAHPHVEIKIVDPATGGTVPRGQQGELCTRGYSVMLGYWQQPDKTAEAIDAAGWMHTGDLASMGVDGYVQITGRLKDMVIRGGENVSPREVEEFLHTHPDIRDAQVVGVPDPLLGEELMAWVQLHPGALGLTDVELRNFATGKLARYKIPRYVRVVDEFPMTASGKVRKVELREAAIRLLGLDPAV
jgi:fatty-acyl-CoA synthase